MRKEPKQRENGIAVVRSCSQDSMVWNVVKYSACKFSEEKTNQIVVNLCKFILSRNSDFVYFEKPQTRNK